MFPILVSCLVAGAILFGVCAFRTQGIKLICGATLLFFALLLGGIGVGAISYPIAHAAAKQGAIGGFKEYWNGSLTNVPEREAIRCTKDGVCTQDYDCDPYDVQTPIYGTDAKGNTIVVGYSTETHYHDCPYATFEYNFVAYDNLGNKYVLGENWFDANPVPWDRFERIPDRINRNKRGIPAQWQRARDKQLAGDFEPVTMQNTYENYILSSERTLHKDSSEDIGELAGLNLLPEHTQQLKDPIRDHWKADKMSFVGGLAPPNAEVWQDSLMHFNAALGTERQGDMHIVAIRASALPPGISSQDYLHAVKAHWQSGLGKDALAKNGIALILGVDDTGSTVLWSQATTGMPIGNSGMLYALSTDLDNAPFTPEFILGHTKATNVEMVKNEKGKSKPKMTYGFAPIGKASQIIMVDNPFVRACMTCKDEGESASQGFVNLSSEIPITTAGIIIAIIIDLLLIVGLWAVAYFPLGVSYWYSSPSSNSYHPYSGYADRSYRARSRRF